MFFMLKLSLLILEVWQQENIFSIGLHPSRNSNSLGKLFLLPNQKDDALSSEGLLSLLALVKRFV